MTISLHVIQILLLLGVLTPVGSCQTCQKSSSSRQRAPMTSTDRVPASTESASSSLWIYMPDVASSALEVHSESVWVQSSLAPSHAVSDDAEATETVSSSSMPYSTGSGKVYFDPKCSEKRLSIPISFVREAIGHFCSDEELLSTNITSPISGLSMPTTLTWSVGHKIEHEGQHLFIDVTYTRLVCRDPIPLVEGQTLEEKKKHCLNRFESIIKKCGLYANEAVLYEGCRVYMLSTGHKSKADRWFDNAGKLKCAETLAIDDKPVKDSDACTCWYSGYPGLTASFKRSKGKSCVAEEIF